ncbi:hypothetical protein [Georgenia soli]|uniref:hypothetical protein n=1 Tax=Georgenia soli TaxID=638953 RepID=UPI002684A973
MTSPTRRIVVVGGVAGGMSAAARARRLDEHADIVVLEQGEFVSFANCGLPYHLSGEIERRDSLLLHTRPRSPRPSTSTCAPGTGSPPSTAVRER